MRINILGMNINVFTSYQEVYKALAEDISSNHRSHYITVNNSHTIVEGARNRVFGSIINQSLFAISDGKPLTLLLKALGGIRATRIFGPSLLEYVLDQGQKDGLRHFFYGSSVEVLEKMRLEIKTKYPESIITGMISPPFKPLTINENSEYLKRMNSSKSDIIWVGLGAPKQEIWMSENYKKCNQGIMIGIGAGFDFLAGNTKHAPVWMKSFALEWLFRLIQEPQRLWKRYLVTNTLFVFYFLKSIINHRVNR